MRYYSLQLTDPNTGLSLLPASNGTFTQGTGPTFSSQITVGGQVRNNPAALNVEFDAPISLMAQPQGRASVRVWGVGLQMLGYAYQLAGKNFSLSAGMMQGLPLASAQASQAGLVLAGQVFQGFGNWQGVNQTLELVIVSGYQFPQTGPLSPNVIAFQWLPGTSLSAAITQAVVPAFPGYQPPVINVLPGLQPLGPAIGYYPSLATFSDWLSSYTQTLGIAITGNELYSGVQVSVVNGNTLNFFDSMTAGQTPAKTIALAFTDLIGQPTWIDVATVNFKTVLRADISIGDLITFPKGVVAPYALTTPAAAVPNAPPSSQIAFQQPFYVNEIHHFANFRQADADSWCTTFRALTTTPTVS